MLSSKLKCNSTNHTILLNTILLVTSGSIAVPTECGRGVDKKPSEFSAWYCGKFKNEVITADLSFFIKPPRFGWLNPGVFFNNIN